MIPIPKPERSESEMFSLYAKDKRWTALEEYLQRCLDHTIDRLGKTENTRDHDMSLKGMKATLEHIIALPKIAEGILKPEKKEEAPDDL